MSTRGAYGYYYGYSDNIRDNFKVTFNRWDAYPAVLGESVVSYIKENSITQLISYFKNLELVKKDSEEYEELLQATYDKGDLSVFNSRGKIPDFFHYLGDSIWCEFAYIINLNDLTLEVFSGHDYLNVKNSRLDTIQDGDHWKPVKLVVGLPLEYIQSKTVEDIITEIGECCRYEEDEDY